MKKLISLLSILFMLILLVPPNQVEGFRGSDRSGRSGVSGGHIRPERPEGYRRPGGSREFDGHDRYRGHRDYRNDWGFFPGLIIGGVIGWSLGPGYYYPPLNESSPPPQGNLTPPSASQGTDNRLFIYPRQGQSEEQQTLDFDECHNWAVGQTGFDPKKPPEGAPDAQRIQKSADYLRAISACLDARGYTVK